MAGLIELSDDVIWYSAAGPYRAVLRGAEAYLDDPDGREALDQALVENRLIHPAAPLLRALDRSVVRLMAELINADERDDGRLDHYAQLRSMVRSELARTPTTHPPEA